MPPVFFSHAPFAKRKGARSSDAMRAGDARGGDGRASQHLISDHKTTCFHLSQKTPIYNRHYKHAQNFREVAYGTCGI